MMGTSNGEPERLAGQQHQQHGHAEYSGSRAIYGLDGAHALHDAPDEAALPVEPRLLDRPSEVCTSLRALVSLDDMKERDHRRNLSILMFVWVFSAMWALTGWMGDGVRLQVMLEFPLILCLVAFAVILTWKCFNNPKIGAILLALAVLIIQSPLVFIYEGLLQWFFVYFFITGFIYGMYRMSQKLMRNWQRELQDEGAIPSIEFWQRKDQLMVKCLRGLLAFIGLGYISALLASVTIWQDDGDFIEVLFSWFISSASFGSLMYFVSLTLLVRDRPSRWILSSGARARNNLSRAAIRRTRQFVLDPNDPLAEPLLLV